MAIIKNVNELIPDEMPTPYRHYRKHIITLLDKLFEHIHPQALLKQKIHVNPNTKKIFIENQRFDLSTNIHVISIGKAAETMAHTFVTILKPIPIETLVVIAPHKDHHPKKNSMESYKHIKRIQWYHAGHPLPNHQSMEAANFVLNLMKSLNEHDVVFILLSGGASALFEAPIEPLTLIDLQYITQKLLNSGATIHEINAIRKHISKVKGGKLALATNAQIVTLIMSDVYDDNISSIGSGPTAPDPSTFHDAYQIFTQYNLIDDQHPAIQKLLNVIKKGMKGDIPETAKQQDFKGKKIANIIIAKFSTALTQIHHIFTENGWLTITLPKPLTGNVKEEVKNFIHSCLDTLNTHLKKQNKQKEHTLKIAIFAMGEVTVHVNTPTKGGRAQEFTLRCLPHLLNIKNNYWAVSAIGTDGIDGNSIYAGAFVDCWSTKQLTKKIKNFQILLDEHRSTEILEMLGNCLIMTGATGSNFADLYAFFFIR